MGARPRLDRRRQRAPTLADPAAALAKGELKFVLHGSKLTGSWALVQMKGRGEKNWLLIKHRDEAARPGVQPGGRGPRLGRHRSVAAAGSRRRGRPL